MVLRRSDRHGVRPVAEGKEARLLAEQALLDDDLTTRLAKHGADSVLRLIQGLRHHDALAGGEPIGLHNDGRTGLRQIGEGGILIGEPGEGGGGDAAFRAQILGESLRAFELRRGLGGSEGTDTGRLEIVD